MQWKINVSHHIIAHKQASTIDTIFYLGETLTGENPNKLSYEDSLIIRTSIHHDQASIVMLDLDTSS